MWIIGVGVGIGISDVVVVLLCLKYLLSLVKGSNPGKVLSFNLIGSQIV
jgi:hypothetical protein